MNYRFLFSSSKSEVKCCTVVHHGCYNYHSKTPFIFACTHTAVYRVSVVRCCVPSFMDTGQVPQRNNNSSINIRYEHKTCAVVVFIFPTDLCIAPFIRVGVATNNISSAIILLILIFIVLRMCARVPVYTCVNTIVWTRHIFKRQTISNRKYYTAQDVYSHRLRTKLI